MATLYGSNKRDHIASYAEGVTDDSDWIYGYDDYDQLNGLGGDDRLQGGRGGDDLYGGAGFDTADYTDSDSMVYVVLPSSTGLAVGWGNGGSATGDLLWSIEGLVGSFFNDTLVGNDDVNVLWGFDGDDTIYGQNGDDFLYGGAGVDDIEGGEGKDYLAGGSDGDRLHGGDGNDVLKGDGGNDFLVGDAGMDDMRGGPGQDHYLVDNNGDTVIEYAEDDDWDFVYTETTYVLTAGSHVETLSALYATGTAAFDLVGNEFDNYLTGNDGMNNLVGGLGHDVLTGRGGSDNFTWTSTADSALADAEADTVMDFVAGADRLVVSPIDADSSDPDNDTFTFIGLMTPGSFTAPGQIG